LARHQFAVFALAAIALTTSFWLLLDIVGAYTRSSPAITVAGFEARFDALRKTIPPRSVLGYLSDNATNDPSYLAEYYLTQYTLAPSIVKPTPGEVLVVVNYHTPEPDRAALSAHNLIPIQLFGDGVMLCRHVKP
jgi:hypothetical protein